MLYRIAVWIIDHLWMIEFSRVVPALHRNINKATQLIQSPVIKRQSLTKIAKYGTRNSWKTLTTDDW
jgi:hypothetical protein